MPRGEYRHTEGAIESFTSAPGPMGWRYFSTIVRDGRTERVDVSVDARGRPVRVRLETTEHHLLVATQGGALRAQLDDEPLELAWEEGCAFVHPSPAFIAVALHTRTEASDLEAISIDPQTLRPQRARRRIEPGGDGHVTTHVGAFDARRWLVDGAEVWIAGTLAVAGDWFELTAYEPGATGPVPRLRSV